VDLRVGGRFIHVVIGSAPLSGGCEARIRCRKDVVQHLVIEVTPDYTFPSIIWSFAFIAETSFPALSSIHLRGLYGLPSALLRLVLYKPGPHLEQLRITDSYFSHLDKPYFVESLMENLSGMKKLKRLYWEESTPRGHASCIGNPSIMRTILELPSLQNLQVTAFCTEPIDKRHPTTLGRLDDDIVGLVAGGGQCNTLCFNNLKIGPRCIAALAEALPKPTCSLSQLRLDLSSSNASHVSDFFRTFRETTPVKNLAIGISYCTQWREQGCLAILADSLRHNTSISAIKLFNGDSPLEGSFQEGDAICFVRMLQETNYTITYLDLAEYNRKSNEENHGELANVISYFTQSNAMGRKKALSTLHMASPDAWINQLLAVDANPCCSSGQGRDHLEVAYYWIRQNPTLFVKAMLDGCAGG
jgi:hypothetical protein